MGNEHSSTKGRGSRKPQTTAEQAAERAKRVVGDLQEGLKNSVKRLDDDHPAAQLLDHVCGTYYHDDDKYRNSRSASYYSEEGSEDGSRRTFQSEDDTTYDGRRGRKSDKSVDSQSYMTHSDYDSDSRRRGRGMSFDTEDESRVTHETEPKLISKPLASSFAKRCYFTKSGIGKTTQHYEGLTLTGNVVLMLASAMKLKGCPTICDEDLRRVEQTYPNQFSRLPDELLLSSGWRRISKYCHFSNKSIPDGIPFFHSKQRLHPSGGYYFLLAGSVGMIRPIDVEPLTKDTLVLLETDFPNQCDATPSVLIRDPMQWVLVNKFCFFSGGPINTEEDVYYQADFDGSPIFMLAFLSPSLTPEELYKLTEIGPENEPGFKSVVDVQEVESVYDLTERDFDDLKLYHLGPCRALPQYVLQPSAWTKVLPPHFLAARQQAMLRAQDYAEQREEDQVTKTDELDAIQTPQVTSIDPEQLFVENQKSYASEEDPKKLSIGQATFDGEAVQGPFHSNLIAEEDVTMTNQDVSSSQVQYSPRNNVQSSKDPDVVSRIDPPDDEPPSLKIESMEENHNLNYHNHTPGHSHVSTSSNLDIDDQGFFRMEPAVYRDVRDTTHGPENPSSHYVSSVSESRHNQDPFKNYEPARFEHPENENSSLMINEDFRTDEMSSNIQGKVAYEQSDTIDHFQESAMKTSQTLNQNDGEFPEDGVNFHEPPPMNGSSEEVQHNIKGTSLEHDQLGYVHDTQNGDEISYDPSDPICNENFNYSDEKKSGVEKDEVDCDLNNSKFVVKKELAQSDKVSTNEQPYNDIDPIDTSHTNLNESNATPHRFSPAVATPSSATESKGHQSPAMRGAHEILKRNRRRRAEANRSLMKKSENHLSSPTKSENPEPTRSEITSNTWDESGTDVTGSAISGSSLLSENSGTSDRTSRRAFILQMAKARMKNNRESPVKASSGKISDDADDTVFTEGNTTLATHDFDFTGDLD
mmetsp:Transcript_12152/g.28836  ORF Transcript_12152/g.28836 Transcript_12152/m.28836 type:complete len:979 (+) Transcript_12152:393-3329(+)|eukprot:CAMPEP_0197173926 /NCGR_PEP_ID=MMETSP1423-20130617/661_1 /TAXON_ID=476441 /ORGANISM="Pseudo-nitzschia heimii, Strain UNC1101" /LENGTH=978 /DNA_ID=CAMNT_0042622797 /DNA_START=328 /DNA_END=3264 /DNA_ORIENTATION=+